MAVSVAPSPPDEPVRRKLTREEVLGMVEAGILGEDERLELIEGELLTMSPQGPPHRMLAIVIRRALERAYGDRAHVQDHSTIDAGPHSLPEPDVAAVRGAVRDYAERLPTGGDLFLVVEVSQTTRAHDRRKAALYARAGVPVYWLVDLAPRTVTVYQDPGDDGYRTMHTLGEDDTIGVPATDTTLPVSELLP